MRTLPTNSRVKHKTHGHYYQEAVKVIDRFVSRLEPGVSEKDILFNNPQFKALMEIFPGIVCVADLPNRGYLYISENTKSMLGFSPDEFYAEGLEKTVTLFPEEQNEVILNKIFPCMFEYFEKFGGSPGVKDLKVSYPTQLISKSGKISWFLHQIIVIHTDENYRPLLLLKLVSDIQSIKKDDSIHFLISQKDEHGIYQTIHSESFFMQKTEECLSVREIEILNLMSQGISSREIAEKLFISEHTVYNHRKNMLRKMEVKRTGELLKKAMASGMI